MSIAVIYSKCCLKFQVMGVLNEVRAKIDAGTEQMFDPLRDIMYVLKDYGVNFPEETYEQVCNYLVKNITIRIICKRYCAYGQLPKCGLCYQRNAKRYEERRFHFFYYNFKQSYYFSPDN